MAYNSLRVYKFGSFRLSPDQRILLHRRSRLVSLPPKALDVLLVLVENRGRLVTKEELLEAVWPGTFVEEGNLTFNISLLRKALGESLKSHRYIQTVAKRGYRFVAKVKQDYEPAEIQVIERSVPEDARSAEPRGSESHTVATALGKQGNGGTLPAADTVSPTSALRLRRAILCTAAILASVAIIFSVRVLRHWVMGASLQKRVKPEKRVKLAGVPPLARGKYVAVLPFNVLGDRASLGPIAKGFAASLSARLFGLEGVQVASPAAADSIPASASPEQVAGDLGANLIIQGTVQGTPERMRVTLELDDLADGRSLWSGEFSGAERDLLTMEDQMYKQVVIALEPGQLNSGLPRERQRSTGNIEAYDLYLKGRDSLRDRQNLKNVKQAVQFQEAALRMDPSFALAYAGLADACLEMYRRKKDSFWSEKAVMAGQRALELNPDNADVHFSMGSVYAETGKAEQAIAELKRGLRITPNSDEGYRRLGGAYLAVGRKQEALQAYQKAVEINPYYWFNSNVLGSACVQIGDYAKALDAFHRVTDLEPDNVYGYENIGAVYILLGRWKESVPVYEKALRLSPSFIAYSNLGTAYFYLRRYNDAVAMFEKAAQMSPNDQVVAGNLADAYRWSGQRDRAIECYRHAIALAYKELQVNPRHAGVLESLALYYAKIGDAGRALELIGQARAIDPNSVQVIYSAAVVNALAGRPQQAVSALRDAFRKGYSREDARADPELRCLRSAADFEKLLQDPQGNAN